MVKGRALARPSERSERFEPLVRGHYAPKVRLLNGARRVAKFLNEQSDLMTCHALKDDRYKYASVLIHLHNLVDRKETAKSRHHLAQQVKPAWFRYKRAHKHTRHSPREISGALSYEL